MNVLISAERIQARVEELAREVMRDYTGRALTVVGILNGSLMFLADLVRHLDLPLRIGFIQASSYRGAATEPGQLRVADELLPDVRGRDVLLLDDILDTGQTLEHVLRQMASLGAVSVRCGVLLRKEGRQVNALKPDYVGFDIPNVFVVGYGLDFNDEYRQLRYVATL